MKQNWISICALMALFFVPNAIVQGGSAIITLAIPPGGESVLNGEAGVGSVLGPMSGWYNPALLAAIPDHTLGDFAYSHSKQKLLPQLGIADLQHEADAGSMLFRNFGPHLDLGVGFQFTRTDFGKSISTNSQGVTIESDDQEWTAGIGIGFAWHRLLYWGSNLKFYDSQLGVGEDRTTLRATGWAFDFGARISPRFELIPDALSMNPGISAVLKNGGQVAFYQDADRSDPLPRSIAGAMSVDLDLWELFWGHAFSETSADYLPESRGGLSSPQQLSGWAFQSLFIGKFQTKLEDPRGKRFETHEGNEFILDSKRLWLTWKRLQGAGFKSKRSVLLQEFFLKRNSWWGISFQPNPRLVFTQKTIYSKDGGIRGQQRELSVSLVF